MLARGGTRNPGEECQFTCSQRLTTHEGGQHGGTRGISDERGDFNHVGSGDHNQFYPFAAGGGKQ